MKAAFGLRLERLFLFLLCDILIFYLGLFVVVCVVSVGGVNAMRFRSARELIVGKAGLSHPKRLERRLIDRRGDVKSVIGLISAECLAR